MAKVKKTIRDEAGEIVAEQGECHQTIGGDKYCIRYNGKFLTSTDTDVLADKVATLIRSERRTGANV